jgi:hypothetical protein
MGHIPVPMEAMVNVEHRTSGQHRLRLLLLVLLLACTGLIAGLSHWSWPTRDGRTTVAAPTHVRPTSPAVTTPTFVGAEDGPKECVAPPEIEGPFCGPG